MKLTSFAAVFVAILIGVIAAPGSSAEQDKSAQIERGKYLVEQVARCGDCHSPVNEKGEPIPGKELGVEAWRLNRSHPIRGGLIRRRTSLVCAAGMKTR